MLSRSLCLLAGFLPAGPVLAVELTPHRGVYDLSLAEHTLGLTGVEGRIAIDLAAPTCEAYDLDYRFVARFGEEGETTLTDQRIVASEGRDGTSYDFTATSLVDGIEQSRVEGSARTTADETRVEMRQPVARAFEIPAALFPLGHTRHIIERARAGERIVQSPLYDGDVEGDDVLTTTAIITPLRRDAELPDGIEKLAGWRVDESYYNSSSDADGLPTFHTRYTLFENGVTDDLYIDFGDYALEGGLSELTLGEGPADCG